MNVGCFEEVKGVEAENPLDIGKLLGPQSDTGLSLVCVENGIRTHHEVEMSPVNPSLFFSPSRVRVLPRCRSIACVIGEKSRGLFFITKHP
jgi:hypothetical protein